MNYTRIILALVVILLIYITYTFFFINSQLITNPISLNNASMLRYEESKLKNPRALRYNYEAWIYIDRNEPQGVNNIIFNRGSSMIVILNGSSLLLFKDGTIYPDGTYEGTEANFIASITDAFPFQKWTQLVISVDGNIVDVYLDGKMIISHPGAKVPIVPKDTPITAGNINTRGSLQKFRYTPNIATPQTVWTSFMKENSLAGLGGFFGSYNIDMSLLKDNEQLFDINII